jgi:1,4-alpha-glucan branching enzyme
MGSKHKINKSKNRKVRLFRMPALEGCNSLYLVGRFNKGYESVYRMQRAEDGTWWLTLELDPDSDYQYRYRSDSGAWYDDPTASKYEPAHTNSELAHA